MFTFRQRGIVIIIVLWFIILITILVAVLAMEVRLSSKIVFANKTGMNIWSDTLTALNVAKMELFIRSMPDPPRRQGENEIPLEERRNKAYRFNGQVLTLAYPIPKTVTVRIYDHAGKIALRLLGKPQMQKLLEHRIGSNDLEKLNTLLDSWQDWIDRDDLKRLKGAEKDFYKKLIVPYEPRNAFFEFVDELLLIKGFEKIFQETNLEAAFTIRDDAQSAAINPNLATKEALMLLPGFDESTVNAILSLRRDKDLKSFQDLNEIMPPEQLTRETQEWINFNSISNVFTVAIIPKELTEKPPEDSSKTLQTEEPNEEQDSEEKRDLNESILSQKQFAYLTTMQSSGRYKLPDVKMVNPYGWLPDMSYENLPPPQNQRVKGSQETKDNTFQAPSPNK